MKLAIVHDFLNQYGGAERVLEALHDVFPEAPVHTSFFLPDGLPPAFRRWDIRTSFMQRLPFLKKHFKKYLPLYPAALSSFDLSAYDVVLSSSSAFAKGARPRPGAVHVCYCYTPMRFVWRRDDYLENEPVPVFLKPLLPAVLAGLRRWDLAANARVTHFVAISECVRERIREAYGRPADVIYPPVRTDRFRPAGAPEDFYLLVSRLNPYKKIDTAVRAFSRLGKALRIVGSGPQESALKGLAGPTVRFLGRVGEEELAGLYARCRGFVFTGEEDFGIAPVEAMAAGRPVIALGRGGARETVLDGVTGVLYPEPTADSLEAAVRRFEGLAFDSGRIRGHAGRFDEERFKTEIRAYVGQKGAAASI